MPMVQGQLMAISAFILVFFLFIARDKIKESNYKLSEIGGFLGGIMSPIALLWVIYGQFQQTITLDLNAKILQQQVEKLSPYLTIEAHILGFESYKNFNAIKEDVLKNTFQNQKKAIKINNEEYLKLLEKKENESMESLAKIFKSKEFKNLEVEHIESLNNSIEKTLFEISPYKNGSQKIKINIENIGEKLEKISIKQFDYYNITPTKPSTDSLKNNEKLTFEIITPTTYLLRKNIKIFLYGVDEKKQKKTYKIEIRASKEVKETTKKLKEENINKINSENAFYIMSLLRSINTLEYDISEIRKE